MSKPPETKIYFENGSKRVFASAIEWPGWCRLGRDEEQALRALIDYGPRYAKAVSAARLGFGAPASTDAVVVVERLKGNATTDFGAPGIAPKADSRTLGAEDLKRQRALLQACWKELDRVAAAAEGVPLAKGPRGGGRDLDAILAHVVSAEAAYVRAIAGSPPKYDEADPRAAAPLVRTAIVEAMTLAVENGLPEAGPRGGKIWPVRYFVRRAAWHVLDHAWEIQDRAGA